MIFTGLKKALLFTLFLIFIKSRELSENMSFSSTNDFEVITNEIKYYDVNSLKEISSNFAQPLRRVHKFGSINKTFEGMLCYARSARDYLINCLPKSNKIDTSILGKENTYHGAFWLFTSDTYQILSSNDRSNSTYATSPSETIFDRSSSKIPFTTPYYILYIPLQNLNSFRIYDQDLSTMDNATKQAHQRDIDQLEDLLNMPRSMILRIGDISRSSKDS